MIYFVELAFEQPEREAAWNSWYSKHLDLLLSVPGVSTAQRFVAVTPCRAPYLAAYSVESPEIFESEPYKQRGGRGSPGVWAPLMTNWDRNLLDGLMQMPDVRSDQYLLVVDKASSELTNFSVTLRLLRYAGLDRTVESRGIAILSADEYAVASSLADESVRFYKTLTPQLRTAV